MNKDIFNSEYLYITDFEKKYKLIRYNRKNDEWDAMLGYNKDTKLWEPSRGFYTRRNIQYLSHFDSTDEADHIPRFRFFPITLERFIEDNFESLL